MTYQRNVDIRPSAANRATRRLDRGSAIPIIFLVLTVVGLGYYIYSANWSQGLPTNATGSARPGATTPATTPRQP